MTNNVKELLDYLEEEYSDALEDLNVFQHYDMSDNSRLEAHIRINRVWHKLDKMGYDIEHKFTLRSKC